MPQLSWTLKGGLSSPVQLDAMGEMSYFCLEVCLGALQLGAVQYDARREMVCCCCGWPDNKLCPLQVHWSPDEMSKLILRVVCVADAKGFIFARL